jgi:hypothetical protein
MMYIHTYIHTYKYMCAWNQLHVKHVKLVYFYLYFCLFAHPHTHNHAMILCVHANTAKAAIYLRNVLGCVDSHGQHVHAMRGTCWCLDAVIQREDVLRIYTHVLPSLHPLQHLQKSSTRRNAVTVMVTVTEYLYTYLCPQMYVLGYIYPLMVMHACVQPAL